MVCQSVCLFVTIVSLAKTAELIKVLFGMWTQVSPRNHVIDGGPEPPWEGAILRVVS